MSKLGRSNTMKMRGCEKTSSCPEKKVKKKEVDFDKSLINNEKQSVFKTMGQGKKLVAKDVDKGRFVVTKGADNEEQMMAKEFDKMKSEVREVQTRALLNKELFAGWKNLLEKQAAARQLSRLEQANKK